MNRGYVRLYRKSLDSGLLRNHSAWILFTYCLLKATHRGYEVIIGNQKLTLEPGQLVFGRRQAAEDTKLSEQQIRTALQSLRNLEILTSKSTNKFTVITIVNWVAYQSPEVENNQQSNQRLTSNQPHTKTRKQKNTLSVDIYAYYLAAVKPEQKTRQRALSNVAHHLKTHTPEALRTAISNYATIAGDREPRFRKDPANFFGKREPAFVDYLPENFQASEPKQQQESIGELLS
ncbi:MAG: hypothetical protein SWH61_12960 [Thermodesulfobacteriota bacterium]|nr:hypothetical protein [Thermodesulfobacteriota bacterium]